MNTLTIVLGVCTVLGTIGTFYYGRKSIRLERSRKTMTWKNIEVGSLDILKQVDRVFHPEIVLMISGPGGVVANLAMVLTGHYYPTYLAMLDYRKDPHFKFMPKQYSVVSTEKWSIYVPEQLSHETDKRIVVIDDCVRTGTVRTAVQAFLSRIGFADENICFAAIVCSEIAEDSGRGPDIYWYVHSEAELYFPWGRWF